MDYNNELAMSNIHNVAVALNMGGMLTCRELAERIMDDLAPGHQISDKIQGARNPARRTLEDAEKQVRQEIRRSLYSHFNSPDVTGFDIYRATAHSDAERFWVAEEQSVMPEYVATALDIGDLARQALTPEEMASVELPDNASLFDRLTATVSGERETVTVHFPNTITIDEAHDVLSTLNEEFEGHENTPGTRMTMERRVNQIINTLED